MSLDDLDMCGDLVVYSNLWKVCASTQHMYSSFFGSSWYTGHAGRLGRHSAAVCVVLVLLPCFCWHVVLSSFGAGSCAIWSTLRLARPIGDGVNISCCSCPCVSMSWYSVHIPWISIFHGIYFSSHGLTRCCILWPGHWGDPMRQHHRLCGLCIRTCALRSVELRTSLVRWSDLSSRASRGFAWWSHVVKLFWAVLQVAGGTWRTLGTDGHVALKPTDLDSPWGTAWNPRRLTVLDLQRRQPEERERRLDLKSR